MAKVMKKAFTLIELLVSIAIIVIVLLVIFRPTKSIVVVTLGQIVLESNEFNEYIQLPSTATNIIIHGNDWYEFTLNGNQWMFRTDGYDRESLVLIPEKTK